MYNLINTFIVCSTYWFAVDNSGKIYTFIAGGLNDTEITIHDNGKWEKIKENAI